MDGEYFRGATCPRDGSWSETSMQVAQLVDNMRVDGIVPTLEGLMERGFDGVLTDVIVVQLASDDAPPDWFAPEGAPKVP
jgi:hypothetical protein